MPSLLSLPAWGSALILLTSHPVDAVVPDALERALAPLVDWLHEGPAKLPPGSAAARAFYGSFAWVAPLGASALAAHAALLASPWVVAVILVLWASGRWGRRETVPPHRRAS